MITALKKRLTPLKSIRRFCLSCAGRPSEVRRCPSTECALFIFKMGRNPLRKGVGWVRSSKKAFSISDLDTGGGLAEMDRRKPDPVNPGANNTKGPSSTVVDSSGRVKMVRTDNGYLIHVTQSNRRGPDPAAMAEPKGA